MEFALTLDSELGTAVRLAHEAGQVVREMRDKGFDSERKADDSLVTSADLAADRIICEGLAEAFPEDGILSEESGLRAGISGRTWIIDPLDGTSGFARGGDDYAIQVGLLLEGEPVLGVVVEPATQRIYRGLKGVGTFFNSTPSGTMRQLRVSKAKTFQEMSLVTSSQLSTASVHRLAAQLGSRLAGRTHSVGCKVGRLVRRDADLYYSVHPISYWDSCAPQVILEAAGGTITELSGQPLRYAFGEGNYTHQGAIAATNGHCHLDFCRQILAFSAEEATQQSLRTSS